MAVAHEVRTGDVRLPKRPLFHLPENAARIYSLFAHPHLPLLFAGTDDNAVHLWDLESRSLLRALAGHTNWVWSLALDPAGRRLATGSHDTTVRLWDLDSGACLRTLADRSMSYVVAVVWEASGSLVASGSLDNTVRVWDATTGALRHTLKGHLNFIIAVAAHPTDDLLASGSSDCTVRVWHWSSGAHVRTLEGHVDGVTSLAASASWLLSASLDRTARVWSWASGACVRVLDDFSGCLPRRSLAWRDSTLVTIENEDLSGLAMEVRAWDTSSEEPMDWCCVGSLASMTSTSYGVAVVGGGRVACVAPDDAKMIAVWGAE